MMYKKPRFVMLQLSDKYSSSQVMFKGLNWIWIRPTSLEDLLRLKNKYPHAPVIMGNTMTGITFSKMQMAFFISIKLVNTGRNVMKLHVV